MYGPDDPNFGMVGEDFHCSTCKFMEVGQSGPAMCTNEDFAAYMKGEAPVEIPAPPIKYCCNAYRKHTTQKAFGLVWISSKPLA